MRSARIRHAGLVRHRVVLFFFFNDTATTEIYTLSLHDALPISLSLRGAAEAISAEVAASRTPRNDSCAPPGSHAAPPASCLSEGERIEKVSGLGGSTRVQCTCSKAARPRRGPGGHGVRPLRKSERADPT